MADETIKNESTPKESVAKHTDEDVARIVQARIKNLHAEKEALAEQLQAAQTPQEGAMQGQPQPNMAQGAPEGTPEVAPSAPSNSPVTQEGLMQALQAQQQQAQESKQQQAQQEQETHHHQVVNKLINEDGKFKDLVEKTPENMYIPREVAMHLSGNLNPDNFKKIASELLTNENAHLKMKNAFLEGNAYGDWGNYDKWLNNILRQPGDERAAPDVVPDLSQDAGEAKAGRSDDNIMNYLATR